MSENFRKLTGILVGIMVISGCSEPDKSKANPKPPVKTESEIRNQLLDGASVSVRQLETLGKSFGEKLTDLTLTEAKECWVNLYTQSTHFKAGDPTGFFGDFTQPDREEAAANRMAFAFYGFDAAVNHLEREKAKADMADAPKSVQNQILRTGDFHKSVVALARCKFEDMIVEDGNLPYYKIFCAGASKAKRNKQYLLQSKMQDHCNALANSFLETGDINPSLLADTPMR